MTTTHTPTCWPDSAPTDFAQAVAEEMRIYDEDYGDSLHDGQSYWPTRKAVEYPSMIEWSLPDEQDHIPMRVAVTINGDTLIYGLYLQASDEDKVVYDLEVTK